MTDREVEMATGVAFKVARVRFDDPSNIEDVKQETVLELLERRKRSSSQSYKFAALAAARRIAEIHSGIVRKRPRDKETGKRLSQWDLIETPDTVTVESAAQFDSSDTLHEAKEYARDRLQLLQLARKYLTLTERRILRARWFEGESRTDTAKRLNLTYKQIETKELKILNSLSRGLKLENSPTLISRSIILEINGVKKSLRDWARVVGIHPDTIHKRVKTGKQGADLIKPPRRKGGKVCGK